MTHYGSFHFLFHYPYIINDIALHVHTKASSGRTWLQVLYAFAGVNGCEHHQNYGPFLGPYYSTAPNI